MAVGKEIRTKIKSIQNTSKITRAMEMVAASKMRRAQERMVAARPYAEKIRNVVAHLANAHPEYRHPYTMERDAKRVGIIIISSDRGLCGGLNVNVFRSALVTMDQYQQQGAEVDVSIIGSKALGFFRRLGANIVSEASHLGDAPSMNDLIGAIKVMLDAYQDSQIDRLYVAGNQFVNTMTQKPEVQQLLPIPPAEVEELKHHWDYLYEPRSQGGARYPARSLYRVSGLSGRGGKYSL